MADEIAQVIQLEYQGMTLAINGSLEVGKFVLQALMALGRTVGDVKNKHTTKQKTQEEESKTKEEEKRVEQLEAPGEKASFKEIMELSQKQGGVFQTFYIPEKYYEEFISLCQKNGLRYCKGVDFIASDGKLPVFIPPHDVIMAEAVYKSILEKSIKENEEAVNGYDELLKETKEKCETASPEEKKDIEVLIENLEQAKAEREANVKETKESLKHGASMSFEDYLKNAKGTEFEKDPDKAISEYEKGVDIDKSFSSVDCLQPIRDSSCVPESKLRFYVPEIGATITRTFEIDEHGLAYSGYSLKTEKGEMYEFSDKNMTKQEWDSNILPEILEKAGIHETTQCRIFNTKEKMEAYIKYHGQVEPESEKQVKEQMKEGKPDFSSADAKDAVEYTMEQEKKKLASAEKDKSVITFEIPQDRLIEKKGKLCVELESGESIFFGNIQSEKIKDGICVFSVDKDAKLTIEKENGQADGQSITEASAASVKESIEKQMKEKVNMQQKVSSHHER